MKREPRKRTHLYTPAVHTRHAHAAAPRKSHTQRERINTTQYHSPLTALASLSPPLSFHARRALYTPRLSAAAHSTLRPPENYAVATQLTRSVHAAARSPRPGTEP